MDIDNSLKQNVLKGLFDNKIINTDSPFNVKDLREYANKYKVFADIIGKLKVIGIEVDDLDKDIEKLVEYTIRVIDKIDKLKNGAKQEEE